MADTQPIIVNNHYPLGYFVEADIGTLSPVPQFWASEERLAPVADYLIIDLGRPRMLNFLDFEMSTKPFDISIEYDIDGTGTYSPVSFSDIFEPTTMMSYHAADDNAWAYLEFHFDDVTTQRVKLTFTRREEPFPFLDSQAFPYSVEVRNARLIRLITTLESAVDERGVFISDSGTDILFNNYETSLVKYPAENVLDGLTETYWQSQPNPSQFAVEALYFDIRPAFGRADQIPPALLSQYTQAELSALTPTPGVVVDEVYIDPLTFGVTMHIYYSNDDSVPWEQKLWTPIPRHYVLKKGYHALPTPTYCKYIKLEFSNLLPTPYNALDYPTLPPMTYRRYPTWVQDYFNGIFPVTAENPDAFIDPFERLTVEPLDFFQTKGDKLDHSLQQIAYTPEVLIDAEKKLEQYIFDTTGQQQVKEEQAAVEAQIEFRPPTFWQGEVSDALDLTRALARYVIQNQETGDDSHWLSEFSGAGDLIAPTQQTAEDLNPALIEKTTPIMWFPRRCRHSYQIIEASRPSKIAYLVGIREVSFVRRDYESQFDEDFYIEALDDLDHIEYNEFIEADWRYVVG